MASVEKETLSQEELRKRLYQTFKSRGVLDTLKVCFVFSRCCLWFSVLLSHREPSKPCRVQASRPLHEVLFLPELNYYLGGRVLCLGVFPPFERLSLNRMAFHYALASECFSGRLKACFRSLKIHILEKKESGRRENNKL